MISVNKGNKTLSIEKKELKNYLAKGFKEVDVEKIKKEAIAHNKKLPDTSNVKIEDNEKAMDKLATKMVDLMAKQAAEETVNLNKE